MSEQVNYSVGDKIKVLNPDKIVKDYIGKTMFSSGIDIEHLRYLCELADDETYEVADVCRSCRYVKIKFSGKYIPLKNELITK